jgi:zinc transporter ZupT
MSRGRHVLLGCLAAGRGTGLGGLIAVIRRPGRRSFGLLMGGAAGVMISLSFMELVNEAWEMGGFLTATLGFAAGAIFMFLVDTWIPHMRFGETEAARDKPIPSSADWDLRAAMHQRPKWPRWRKFEAASIEVRPEPGSGSSVGRQGAHIFAGRHRWRRRWLSRTSGPVDHALLKTGLLISIGITIHNMPEGIAVGAGYAHQPQFGYFIALAIAMHNIPEGIATALPLCKGGACKWDAFRIALLSGLTEPVGALLAIFLLSFFQALVPAALAFAGGVMTFITLDELIPTAREHGHQHWTAVGIILGAIFVFLLSGIFGV